MYNIEKEYQANFFARALLMPESEYRAICKQYTDDQGIIHTKPIADYFHVTISDVHLRNRDLQII